MDKTIVSFENDITAVVGPNGCGKSNIVDSIRWVLGEQSAKHLRGKSMEDVIFSGSETRPALSMASVELTFSTEGTSTPAAHLNQKEISIGRKLYRTGESEYFINRTPARLKDITDLFLGTGIGTKAYSVIEQGRISQVVTAKPEERRYYIEEVAGISKFKSRKEAALRKMDATRQNLLRLNDIITELDRQLKSLDRQAKKAQKYKEVKDEFQKWDLSLSASLFSEYNKNQNELEQALRVFDETERNLQAQLQESENNLESFKFKLLEKEEIIQQSQNRLFELTNLIRLAEASSGYKKEELSGLNNRLIEADSDLIRLEDQIEEIIKNLFNLNEDKVQIDLDAESVEEELQGLDMQVQTLRQQVDELVKTIATKRNESHRIQNRLVQIETLKSGLIQKREDLVLRLTREESDLEIAEQNYRRLDRDYKETSEGLSGLKQMKLDLNIQADELKAQVIQAKADLESEQKQLLSIKEDLALKRSRLASLEELQRNFEGYQEGTRSVLLKKGDISSDGIYGTVADYIETENTYEGAVSAVLGEKLQFVVVKGQKEGCDAVNFLNVAASGRTSFVPMEFQAEAISAQDEPVAEGVLGPLESFVKIRGGFEHLRQFLFGDTYLVNDLSQALNNWANGVKKTYVTLAGEVIDKSGVITGGSLAQTSVALLEKKREIKFLTEKVAELELVHGEKMMCHASLADKIKNLEAMLDSLKKSSVEEEIRINNQEKDISHFKKELESLVAKQKELKERIEKEQSVLSLIQPQFDDLVFEETELRTQYEELVFAEQTADTELAAIRGDYDSKAQYLSSLKFKKAQINERLKNNDQEMLRLQSEKIRLRFELAKKEEQANRFESRLSVLEKDIEHLKKYIDIKIDRKQVADEELMQLKIEYDAQADEMRHFEQSIRDLRRSYQEANQRLNKITLELTETRGHLKALFEQVLERHQLNLSEVWEEHFNPELNREEAQIMSKDLKDKLMRLGEVNTAALQEFDECKTRFDFLSQQKADLESSLNSLERVIQKINRTTKERFLETFNAVNEKFQMVFPHLFHGGKARLLLTNEDDLLETGVEIVAQPPGKKLQSISLLSGGEKALTAVSLIFAIFQIKPSPFCILDEVDAPLDEVNVGRYNEMIREMTDRTQFIVITHNKRTMEMADILYGVTMQEAGVSQLVSVNMQ